ncbi:NUDIX hydrolase [beta proteobacterium AAP121]|nr:NUDIX hydrolase [beta proteobacterium AAP65]KPG00613.1 NUDIX hydrolase [beta proteobacterium AAP121]
MNAPFYEPPAGTRPSASLLLLRNAADGLEVLMLRRAERDGDQRSGAAVFPGGQLDARDHAAHALCLGPTDAEASALLGVAAGGLDYYIAAVRETFEEAGLLLATGTPDLAALHPWRDRLQSGEASFVDFCQATGVQPELRGLVYAAHWLTPLGAPKRFDTRFFAVRAPAGQQAEVDHGEAVALMWLRPAQALDKALGLKLLPVTRELLKELAGYHDVDAALAAMAERAARGGVPLVEPRRALTARGPGVVLPHELPYAEIGRLDPSGHGEAHATLLAGRVVALSPRVLRITAPNPGPMTGPGTNTYLVGGGEGGGWTAIDPGPDSEPHLQALLAALAERGGRLERILVTHTHRDHSPGAAALAAATGAPVWGRVADHPAWQDESFRPDHVPQHAERIFCGNGATLRVWHTPGHASNHLCYLLEEERLLFTGDHVMQGSTVVINPPDGDMVAYLASLHELLAEPLDWLAPGHGYLVAEPHAVLRALIAHRLKREAKVALRLQQAGPGTLAELVGTVYDDAPVALHGVAQRSLLAHLLKLRSEGRAVEDAQQRWAAVAR